MVFGADGAYVESETAPLGANQTVQSVCAQPDGKFLAAIRYDYTFRVTRINADGSLDTSFGATGTASAVFPDRHPENENTGDALINEVSVQPDGKILAAGSNFDFAAARFLADGSLDGAFGDSGLFEASFAGRVEDQFMGVNAIVPLADGRIALAGSVRPADGGYEPDLGAMVLTADGQLDPASGTGGQTTVTIPGDTRYDDVEGAVAEADGKLLLAAPKGLVRTMGVNTRPDLRLDSNNDGLIGEDDDLIEDDATKPGKIIAVNDDDTDGDAIPDFVDGYNYSSSAANDDQTAGGQFTPVKLTIPADEPLTNMKIKLAYDASDPIANILPPGVSASGQYEISGGHLRLWTKDGGTARNGHDLTGGGDWINSGAEYTPAQLGITDTNRTVTLYLEAVAPSTAQGDQQLTAEVALNAGANPSGQDSVRLTSLKLPQATDESAVDTSIGVTSRLIWTGGLYASSFKIERLNQDGLTWSAIATVDNSNHMFDANQRIYDVTGITDGANPNSIQDGTICSWRITGINVLGQTVGDPFRNHVGVDPAPGNSFSVYAMKQDAFDLLQSDEELYRGKTFYRAAGVDKLLNQLTTALEMVSVQIDDTLPSDTSAQYGDNLNELRIRSNAVGEDVVHELVHAWDDLNDWYITAIPNYEAAEVLAYGTEYLLAAVADGVGHLARMDTTSFANANAAQTYWGLSWQTLNAVVGDNVTWKDVAGSHTRALTVADVADVTAKLGLHFSAGTLLPIYNAMLHSKQLAFTLNNSFGFTLNTCFA